MADQNNENQASQTTNEWLSRTLEKVKSGEMTVAVAIQELSVLPYENMDFARVDHHRNVRLGFPEVIFGRGKTVEQIVSIAEKMAAHADKILVTHAIPEAYAAVKGKIADAAYNPTSRTIMVNRSPETPGRAGVVVVTDLPVAEEAAVTAELMGNKVERVFDVGVAGIHRLFDQLPLLRKARVLVVVAGMEGALASVIGGLVSIPIVAVPTSVGYGASFNGLAPLLTMLNSCAPGVAVVNIDNGFGAGYYAGLINLGNNTNTTNTK